MEELNGILVVIIIFLGVLKIGYDGNGYESGWLDNDKD